MKKKIQIMMGNKPYRTIQIGNHLWVKSFVPDKPESVVVAIRKRGQGELTLDYYDMFVLLEQLNAIKERHETIDKLSEEKYGDKL